MFDDILDFEKVSKSNDHWKLNTCHWCGKTIEKGTGHTTYDTRTRIYTAYCEECSEKMIDEILRG